MDDGSLSSYRQSPILMMVYIDKVGIVCAPSECTLQAAAFRLCKMCTSHLTAGPKLHVGTTRELYCLGLDTWHALT
jgi:hypothetical protein